LEFNEDRKSLVRNLFRQGLIKNNLVKRALSVVPREKFVWEGDEDSAYYDSPQSLGGTGQTISAPHMVAIMLEEMDLRIGLNVLEVGAGSGYNAALIAEIIAPLSIRSEDQGHVTAVERVKDLVEFAENNLRRTGYSDRVSVHLGDGTLGFPEMSNDQIYDRIVVTAAAPIVPRYLLQQLKIDGQLLIPVGDRLVQTLQKISKSPSKLDVENICECMFVPLIGENGYP
jgi:protein-L-isoaspartate(D-aspartate) O-methyltransferase